MEPEENKNEKRHLTSAERQELYKKHAASSISSEFAQKKSRRRLTLIAAVTAAIVVAAAVTALIYCNINIWKPARTYRSADALYNSEDYMGAYSIFNGLGEYKDSAARASDCIVMNAKKLTGRDDALIKTSAEMPWFSIDEEGTLKFDEDSYTGDGNIVIPDIFDGIAVSTIGDKCFFYADFMTSVEIPATVTKIGERAFYSCSALTSLTLPDSVKEIGTKSFAECTSLTEVKLSASLEALADRSFFNCTALTKIELPEGLRRIESRAFNACSALEEITLPSALEFIGNYAFTGCVLKKINYGGTKEALEAICVNEDGKLILDCENIIYK